jgi:hypothetical protein
MQFLSESLAVFDNTCRYRTVVASVAVRRRKYFNSMLCALDSEMNQVAKHRVSGTDHRSAPGALVAALGMLERLGGLALPARACSTALGAGPVVERAAVLSLDSLALDW